jgi:ankyrin repeat protein
LHCAILAGHDGLVELLLETGVDVNAESSTIGTPLCLAILKEHTRMIEMLLKKYRASIDLAHPKTGTALHCATFIGSETIAATLLDLGARPDALSRVHLPSLRKLHQSSVDAESSGMYCEDLERAAPLMMAVFQNRPRLAAILADAGAPIAQPCDIRTDFTINDQFEGPEIRSRAYPLGIAAFCGFANMLEWLILRGADVHSQGIFGIPPVLLASMCGNFDTVRQFYSIYVYGFPITKYNVMRRIRYRCALSGEWVCGPPADENFATSQSRDACVTILCRHGASVNVTHTHRDIAPLLVAAQSKRLQCVEILLQNHADPDSVRGREPMTALQWSANIGSTSMMSTLLAAGADLRTVDSGGFTSLALAIEGRHSGVVDMILTRLDNSNTEARDPLHERHLNRILSLVLNLSDQGPYVSKECLNVAARLIGLGTEVDTADSLGDTALHHAASAQDKPLVSRFLNAGAKISIKDRKGNSALHRAMPTSDMLLVRKLLDAGAKVDEPDRYGNTVLYSAASDGNDLLVSELLDAGASVNFLGHDGVTALHIAAMNGHKAVVSRLLIAGSDATIKCTHDNMDWRAKDWTKRYGHDEVHDMLHQHEWEIWRNTRLWTFFYNIINRVARQSSS